MMQLSGAHNERRKRILIVEDEPVLLEMLVQLLEPDYDVVAAADGLAGLLQTNGPRIPDLIITDIAMPKLDGMGMIMRMRQKSELADVPVIFLTSRDSPDTVVETLKLGARHCVGKPFSVHGLAEKVRRILSTTDEDTVAFATWMSDMGYRESTIHRTAQALERVRAGAPLEGETRSSMRRYLTYCRAFGLDTVFASQLAMQGITPVLIIGESTLEEVRPSNAPGPQRLASSPPSKPR